MSTQGRGSKQGPGFFKPRSPSAMTRPWPFQKGSGYKGAVLERGAPLARKIHKEKIIHSNHGHEISPVVSAWALFVCGCFISIAGVANIFCSAPLVWAGPAVYAGTCRGGRGSCISPGAYISTPAASLIKPIPPLGSIPGFRAPLSSVLAGISKPATPHKKAPRPRVRLITTHYTYTTQCLHWPRILHVACLYYAHPG
jgi:hypothetical protein